MGVRESMYISTLDWLSHPHTLPPPYGVKGVKGVKGVNTLEIREYVRGLTPPTPYSVKGVKGVNSMAVSKWAPPPPPYGVKGVNGEKGVNTLDTRELVRGLTPIQRLV